MTKTVKDLLQEHADWIIREGISVDQVHLGTWEMTPDRKAWTIDFSARLDNAFKEGRL